MANGHVPYSGPIVTRAQAKREGLTNYFTSKPCIRGHIDQRNTKNKKCRSCAFIWKKNDIVGNNRRHQREVARRNERKEEMAGSRRPKICEVCGDNNKRIRWDHCHYTGKFRGWICTRCNSTFGYVDDSPELLRRMAEYLEAHGTVDRTEKKFASSNDFRRTQGSEVSNS